MSTNKNLLILPAPEERAIRVYVIDDRNTKGLEVIQQMDQMGKKAYLRAHPEVYQVLSDSQVTELTKERATIILKQYGPLFYTLFIDYYWPTVSDMIANWLERFRSVFRSSEYSAATEHGYYEEFAQEIRPHFHNNGGKITGGLNFVTKNLLGMPFPGEIQGFLLEPLLFEAIKANVTGKNIDWDNVGEGVITKMGDFQPIPFAKK